MAASVSAPSSVSNTNWPLGGTTAVNQTSLFAAPPQLGLGTFDRSAGGGALTVVVAFPIVALLSEQPYWTVRGNAPDGRSLGGGDVGLAQMVNVPKTVVCSIHGHK